MEQSFFLLFYGIICQIEKEVIAYLGDERITWPGGKETALTGGYDDWDTPYLVPFHILSIFVEDGSAVVRLKDRDGDEEEVYLHDFQLCDIGSIISCLE